MSSLNLPPYSVLMSVYVKDDPEYLNLAIGSMVAQTVPFEDMVIVCDGPLTDGLNEVLSGWQTQLGNRLKILRLPKNVGLGSALSEGMPLCSCDIVARMDADDISRLKRCEKQLIRMNQESLDVVGGYIEEFNRVPGDMKKVRQVPISQEAISEFAKRRNPFNHMTVMFKKDTVEQVGGYQPFSLLEDYWLWGRLLMNGAFVSNLPEVLVDVRVGSGMYARRSGLAYFKSQRELFRAFRQRGFISKIEEMGALIERGALAMMPSAFLKMIYSVLLRRRH